MPAHVAQANAGANIRIIWAQEEPENFGAWYFMNAFMKKNAKSFLGDASRQLEFVGRFESASPATGSRASHLLEQKKLLDEAFG